MKERTIFATVCILLVSLGLMPGLAGGHCDTLDGPVVAAARAALEKGDVTPILKWVKKENEPGIREQFLKTLSVRTLGKEARELTDMYFFETLVRIHRAGEGAPYTGLKPAGAVEPAVAAADKALEANSPDGLIRLVNGAAEKGIRDRFARAAETRKHAEESVEAGRRFVEAYVEFTHYVERLHADALGPSGHARHEAGPAPAAEGHQHH